jgi:hypothetical protein
MIIGFLIVILLMLLANLGIVIGIMNGEVQDDEAINPFTVINLLVTMGLITWNIYCLLNL